MGNAKFILFCFDYYYPSGGANDCVGEFDTVEEAKAAYDGKNECAQIAVLDGGELIVVMEGYSRGWKNPESFIWEDKGRA